MTRHIVLTTLEEDMKELGLMAETPEEDPGPAADPEGGYTDGEEPKETDSRDQPVPPEIKTAINASADDDEDDEKKKPDLDEDDDGDEDDEKKAKDDEKVQETISRLSKNFLRRHGLTESRKPVTESRPASRGPVRPAADRVFALLQEVRDVVEGLHREKNRERIEGFQNVALVADILSGRFRKLGMALSEGSLFRIGGVMQRLAEDAAQTAAALEVPPEAKDDEDEKEEQVDDSQIDELFKKFMSKLLDALQLYNDTTKSEGDEGDEDDVQPGDDEEEPMEGADDDEDDEPAPDSEPEPKAEGDDADADDEPESDDEPEEAKVGLKDDEDEDDDDEPPKDPNMSESIRILEAARRRLKKKVRRGKKSEGKGRKLLNQGRKMRKPLTQGRKMRK